MATVTVSEPLIHSNTRKPSLNRVPDVERQVGAVPGRDPSSLVDRDQADAGKW